MTTTLRTIALAPLSPSFFCAHRTSPLRDTYRVQSSPRPPIPSRRRAPWTDTELRYLPYWQFSDRPTVDAPPWYWAPPQPTSATPTSSTINYTRSLSLVRGVHENASYFLLSEDVALAATRTRSDGTHSLSTQMALPTTSVWGDVQNPRVYVCPVSERNQLVLSEVADCDDQHGDRRLLVQLLSSSSEANMTVGSCAVEGTDRSCGRSDADQQFIVITTLARRWQLQVLLWAHRKGQPLPNVTSSPAGDLQRELRIEWAHVEQRDVWSLDSTWGTHPISLRRNGAAPLPARPFTKQDTAVSYEAFRARQQPESFPPSSPNGEAASACSGSCDACPFSCQVLEPRSQRCMGAHSSVCPCPPAQPWSCAAGRDGL